MGSAMPGIPIREKTFKDFSGRGSVTPGGRPPAWRGVSNALRAVPATVPVLNKELIIILKKVPQNLFGKQHRNKNENHI